MTDKCHENCISKSMCVTLIEQAKKESANKLLRLVKDYDSKWSESGLIQKMDVYDLIEGLDK